MIQIVKMEDRHVSSVAEIENMCFSSPWSVNSVQREVDNPLSLWLVAEESGAVVGYVGSQTVLGEADMMNLAVLPDYRRQGIAGRLVEALVQELCSIGAYQLTLEVRASNEPAKALYDRLGFMTVGRRPNYYTNPKEDALILRKEWTV